MRQVTQRAISLAPALVRQITDLAPQSPVCIVDSIEFLWRQRLDPLDSERTVYTVTIAIRS